MRGTGQLLLFVLFVSNAAAQTPSDAELSRRVQQLEEQVRRMQVELDSAKSGRTEPEPAKEPSPPSDASESEQLPMAEVIPGDTGYTADLGSEEMRMPFAGYMDFHFNKEADLPGVADFHRFVLLFGHSFNRRIQFWSEIEVEHALVSTEEESGELEVEQAYLDFLLTPRLNFRSGIVLAPVGLVNERHEPPAYNGVERPFVDTVVLPTTWFGPGAGIHGDLGRGVLYKLFVMDALDSSKFTAGGIRDGRQKAFVSVFQNPAVSGRLEYHGLAGSSIGGSFWTGKTGFATPGINPRMSILEFDGRFSLGRFDFRGEFVQTFLRKTAELNTLLQRTTGVSPNIAARMRGFYGEAAVHLLPTRSRHDLVAFTRFENFNTQQKMASGFLPLRHFDRDAFVTGLTYFPEPDVALKFDYTVLRSQSSFIRSPDSLNLGIGWWF